MSGLETSDVYRVLGLDRNADPEDVKTAYRYLSKKYHPDRTGDPSTSVRFVRVAKAYKVLNMQLQKERYLNNSVRDRFRAQSSGDDIFSLGSLALTSDDIDIREKARIRTVAKVTRAARSWQDMIS